MSKTVIVTGGAGFIGSCVVRQWMRDTEWHIVCLDKLHYARNVESLKEVQDNQLFQLEVLDICYPPAVAPLLPREQPAASGPAATSVTLLAGSASQRLSS